MHAEPSTLTFMPTTARSLLLFARDIDTHPQHMYRHMYQLTGLACHATVMRGRYDLGVDACNIGPGVTPSLRLRGRGPSWPLEGAAIHAEPALPAKRVIPERSTFRS